MMKDNKLIAEFMIGAWNLENLNMQCDNSYDLYSVSELSDVFAHIESDDLDAKHFFTPDEMLFYKLWDWLMPVVQKCYKIDNEEGFDNLVDAVSTLDLGGTYEAVVEFIIEYNNEAPTNEPLLYSYLNKPT
jgi:hypothetical protein